jgi:hypothetical protein
MNLFSHHSFLFWSNTYEEARVPWSEISTVSELYVFKGDVLKISDTRLLIEKAQGLPLEKEFLTIVIAVSAILPEAQQALLKILEEPPLTTKFIIILPPGSFVIPTIRSRCVIASFEQDMTRQSIADEFQKFLAMSVPERIDFISLIHKKKDDSLYELLFTSVKLWIAQHSVHNIKNIIHVLPYLPQKGASKKMIWEYIAFTLPVEK